MGERYEFGYSKLGASEFRNSGWDRLRKAGLFLIACVLLAVFFYYLTREVQVSTGHATSSDASWDNGQITNRISNDAAFSP